MRDMTHLAGLHLPGTSSRRHFGEGIHTLGWAGLPFKDSHWFKVKGVFYKPFPISSICLIGISILPSSLPTSLPRTIPDLEEMKVSLLEEEDDPLP